jgi:hypothetical protein
MMETTFRPISKRRLAELKGYVAPGIIIFRAALFLIAVGTAAFLTRQMVRGFAQSGDAAWILPTALFGVGLYVVSSRWTGGRSFRAKVRADLAGGVAAAHRIVAVDTIQVEEREDEGPAFFVLTEEGETILFAGQYLESYKRKGFPWRSFEILEAPESRIFFGLVPLGARLTPSARRPPFSWEEFKRYRVRDHHYGIIDEDFNALKEAATTSLTSR